MLQDLLLSVYEQYKNTTIKMCERHRESLKEDPESIKFLIYKTENYKSELEGMLVLLHAAEVIDTESEKKVLEELFSPERLYGAKLLHNTGKLFRCTSEKGNRNIYGKAD